MRVLHLSSTDLRGGAARGAYWLHRALEADGVDSHMLVGRKYGTDSRVAALGGRTQRMNEALRGTLDRLPLTLYRKTAASFWTVGWMRRDLGSAIAAYDPDVVHLHWTGAGFLPVSALKSVLYPIVWTLRDMWAITGGCHYTAGCERYRSGCGLCPQLRSTSASDISRLMWTRRAVDWSAIDLNLVPISTWLADCVRASPLFRTTPIDVIPNGIDTGVFSPQPREAACRVWGLDPAYRYILFGAFDALRDDRKGFPQLVEALRHLAGSCWSRRAKLLVFGDLTADTAPELALDARFLGPIHEDRRLASLYAAADVMVVPSVQEAFGKTIVEAMACGTPVVAFAQGGPVDIVSHRESGYLARPVDSADLAAGIAWCVESPERAAELGHAARRRAAEQFDIRIVARRYRELYERLRDSRR